MLADFGFVAVPIVILLGIVAFFAFVAVVIFKLVAGVFRTLFGTEAEQNQHMYSAEAHFGPARLCDQPRCGHANPPTARFCARCGARLRQRDLFA